MAYLSIILSGIFIALGSAFVVVTPILISRSIYTFKMSNEEYKGNFSALIYEFRKDNSIIGFHYYSLLNSMRFISGVMIVVMYNYPFTIILLLFILQILAGKLYSVIFVVILRPWETKLENIC